MGFEILHQVLVVSQRQLTLLKLLGNAKSCLAFWLPNYYNELLALLDLKEVLKMKIRTCLLLENL